jgi:hypothetical protein
VPPLAELECTGTPPRLRYATLAGEALSATWCCEVSTAQIDWHGRGRVHPWGGVGPQVIIIDEHRVLPCRPCNTLVLRLMGFEFGRCSATVSVARNRLARPAPPASRRRALTTAGPPHRRGGVESRVRACQRPHATGCDRVQCIFHGGERITPLRRRVRLSSRLAMALSRLVSQVWPGRHGPGALRKRGVESRVRACPTIHATASVRIQCIFHGGERITPLRRRVRLSSRLALALSRLVSHVWPGRHECTENRGGRIASSSLPVAARDGIRSHSVR